jgi:anti-anti-sigma factor
VQRPLSGHLQPFDCTIETAGGRAWVRPRGELDLWTVGTVEQHLHQVRADGYDPIELDLAGLSFLDSTGVALVVRWSRASVAHGFDLHVRAGSGHARRAFEISAITHLLVDPTLPGRLD